MTIAGPPTLTFSVSALARRTDHRPTLTDQSRLDGTAELCALRAHQVEVRARPQVDDDRRTAELVLRGQRVGEPVRAGLGGAIDLDLQDPLQAPGVDDE